MLLTQDEQYSTDNIVSDTNWLQSRQHMNEREQRATSGN
jgi:hypothetical protein